MKTIPFVLSKSLLEKESIAVNIVAIQNKNKIHSIKKLDQKNLYILLFALFTKILLEYTLKSLVFLNFS